MILHLDPHFNPCPDIKQIHYESFTFSGGEPHIKILTDLTNITQTTVSHRLTSFNDMGLLLIACDALRRSGVQQIKAIIPYFPAARQDRVMVPGESLSVKVYADLINQLQLEEVTIFDPHSEVTPALLHNCTAVSNHAFIKKVASELADDLILISPDGGALKKIYKLAAHLKKYKVVECGKTRDIHTGQLSGFKVYADDLQGKDCLVVDDICDGGGTFMGLATELKKKNAGNLFLAVSHGIFSKGLEDLGEHYQKIFTTDSFRDLEETEKIKQIHCL